MKPQNSRKICLFGIVTVVCFADPCHALDAKDWCCMLPADVSKTYSACKTVACADQSGKNTQASSFADRQSHVGESVVIDPELAEMMGTRPRSEGQLLSSPEIFEGDILGISPGNTMEADKNSAANFVRAESLRWPGGTVPFILSKYFRPNDRKAVRKALADFTSKTPITFRPGTGADADHLYIAPGIGCASMVGRQGGRQQVALHVPGCMGTGFIHHEIMHAIGFFHEQSRTDRDKYVEINWENIPDDQKTQFQSYSNQEITAFGKPYDFASILHYAKHDFAKDPGVWTIRPKNGKRHANNVEKMGQRDALSQIDLDKIQLAYNKESDKACPTSKGWLAFQNRCYFFSFIADDMQKVTFSKARTICREKGARIANSPKGEVVGFFQSQMDDKGGDLEDNEMIYVENCNTIAPGSVNVPEEADCDSQLHFICSKRISVDS